MVKGRLHSALCLVSGQARRDNSEVLKATRQFLIFCLEDPADQVALLYGSPCVSDQQKKLL